jgi:uncharacterized protein DUF1573
MHWRRGCRYQGIDIMVRFSMTLLTGVCLLAPLGAAEGLSALFDTQSHDFGNVPIGPAIHHDFKIKNTTNQTLHIANLRVSCGCTTPSTPNATILPGETGIVHAQMDTRRFSGAKSVTVFVLFDQPVYQEVSLVVSAFGRNDVAVSNPESFEFGRMRKGTSPAMTSKISFATSVRITQATADSGYVKVSVAPKQDQYGGNAYELTAKISPNVPVGNWYTDVWATTDAGNRIRIPLTVVVEPSLTITPGIVEFDATPVGHPAEKSIIVKGDSPFRIIDVKGGGDTFTASDKSSESKTTHVVRVTFKPGKEGDYVKNLEILTDMKDQSKVQLAVKGTGMK